MRADLINAENIAEAIRRSNQSPIGRAIVPLMLDGKPLMGPDSKNQYFLNAFQPGTEVDIHLHQEKMESFFLLQGKLKVILFSAEGEVEEIKILENKGDSSFVSKGRFHTVAALQKDTVVYEFKEDKYDPLTDKVSAPWAPQEEARADFYKRWLVECKVGDRAQHYKMFEQPKTPNTLINERNSTYGSQYIPSAVVQALIKSKSQEELPHQYHEGSSIAPLPASSIAAPSRSEQIDRPEVVASCFGAFAEILSKISLNLFLVNTSAASSEVQAPAPVTGQVLVQTVKSNNGVVINKFYNNCAFFEGSQRQQGQVQAQVEYYNSAQP